MTILASQIIDAAARELYDVDNINWSRTELLGFLSEAEKQIVILQPQNNSTIGTIDLVPGCQQAIPSGAYSLIDVYHNVAADGETPRRVVRVVSRRLLNSFNPDWMYATSATEVDNVVFDEQDRRHFWVYPPNDGEGKLNVAYLQTPSPFTTESNAITVSDAYYTALLEFMLFRACSKVAPFSPGPTEAARHFSLFTAALAAKAEIEAVNTPNDLGNTS